MESRPQFCPHRRNLPLTPTDAKIPICIQRTTGPGVFSWPLSAGIPPNEPCPFVAPLLRKRRPFWKRLGRAIIGFTLHTLAIPAYLGMGLFYGGLLSMWALSDALRKKQIFDSIMMCGVIPPAALFGVFFCLVLPFKTFCDRMKDKKDVPFWHVWPWGIDAT